MCRAAELRVSTNLTSCTSPSTAQSLHESCHLEEELQIEDKHNRRPQTLRLLQQHLCLCRLGIWPQPDIYSVHVLPTRMQMFDSCLQALHENRHLKEELQGERKRRKIAMDALSWSGAPQVLQTLLPPGPLPQQSTVQLPVQPMAQPPVPLTFAGRLLCLSAQGQYRVPT